MPRADPDGRLARCIAACRSLLAADRGMLADFDVALAGPRPRWELLPDDLRHDFADIAWDHLVASGLAPAAGERLFIERRERRCPDCEGPDKYRWNPQCSRCDGTHREVFERRCERPPTLRSALVLAAADLPAAEAVARAAAVRLWPWRGRHGALPRPGEPPRTIAWRVDELEGPLELMRRTAGVCPLAYAMLVRTCRRRSGGQREYWDLEELTRVRPDVRPNARWQHHPDRDRQAAALYDELVAADERIPDDPALRSRRHAFPPGGQPYAALANPFTPLCELAALGVAIERLESDCVVVARKA